MEILEKFEIYEEANKPKKAKSKRSSREGYN